jgi:sodium-dependent dicarboxylate transporter 2/3/5
VVVVAMSTVMSNTVACNIILPLALAIGVSVGGETDLQVMAVMIAVGASFGMGLPISTPPNVIAYSTGEIDTRDMIRVGGITSIVVTAFIVLTGPRVLNWLLS